LTKKSPFRGYIGKYYEFNHFLFVAPCSYRPARQTVKFTPAVAGEPGSGPLPWALEPKNQLCLVAAAGAAFRSFNH
jgi:hypothetical protein